MIEVRGVAKSYGPLKVLLGVDLDIAPAQITAIVGPNASGKTTINKIVLGLVRPDAGTVRFDGVVVNATSAYRRRIGYMPQAARFPENLCAHDVLAMLTDLRGSGASRDEELLQLFELQAIMRAPLRTLSGGMRQRVNAAIAFLFAPDLLILDEPTAGLDPISSSTLKDKMLRDRANGRTFIITSHVMSELQELSDRIVFLLDGHIRFSGSQQALKEMTGEATLERAIASLMQGTRVPPPAASLQAAGKF
ncbi:MAG: ABC transporter ATP-binding protein [Gemmatimonadaceae bacterium]